MGGALGVMGVAGLSLFFRLLQAARHGLLFLIRFGVGEQMNLAMATLGAGIGQVGVLYCSEHFWVFGWQGLLPISHEYRYERERESVIVFLFIGSVFGVFFCCCFSCEVGSVTNVAH